MCEKTSAKVVFFYHISFQNAFFILFISNPPTPHPPLPVISPSPGYEPPQNPLQSCISPGLVSRTLFKHSLSFFPFVLILFIWTLIDWRRNNNLFYWCPVLEKCSKETHSDWCWSYRSGASECFYIVVLLNCIFSWELTLHRSSWRRPMCNYCSYYISIIHTILSLVALVVSPRDVGKLLACVALNAKF